MPTWIDSLWSLSLPLSDVALRLAAATGLSGIIGFEREISGRAAGLRTHMLVGLAAALFTIIAFEMFSWIRTLEDQPPADPLRLLEAITAGVAFLAAGTIFRSQDGVRGLTTGAGLWMAGAVGMAAGQGMIALAVLATALAAVILAAVHLFDS